MYRNALLATAFSLLIAASSWTQSGPVASRLGYPQMILHNGKIVTMDDDSFESRVGTIVEAMAVRDETILATGTNAEVLELAGPETRRIDLKGRTVLPSFIITHEHPMDWAFQEPRALTRVFPPTTTTR